MRAVAVVVWLAACGGGEAAENADARADVIDPPPECALGSPPAGWSYPAGPYGAQVGERFADLTLGDCNLQPVSFGDILAQSELTLFNVGAGWCQPCIEESETLDAEIFRAYCERGLRVVQVLFQDDDSFPATSLFCQDWTERFGISFPVLVDPLFDTSNLFERAQTPLNLLIDRDATIVFRETGTPAPDLAARIDQMLPL